MGGIFHGYFTFNQDLSKWDVSAATNMLGMFYRASAFVSACVCVFVCLPVCLSVCTVSVSLCMRVYVFACLPVCLSVCMSVSLSLCL